MAAFRSVALSMAVVFATASCIVSDTCLAYFDTDGVWHESFDCDGLLDGGDTCCGTLFDKYCCFNDEDDAMSAGIIALIVGVIVVVVIIGICIAVCVCCCDACRHTTTTTRYVQQTGPGSPTVVVAQSSQQQSVAQPYAPGMQAPPPSATPGVGYMPTAASNPMAQYPPPYAQGGPPKY